MSEERYDYQQQLDDDERRRLEERAWLKKYREAWAAWAKEIEPVKEKSNEPVQSN